jgi:glucose-6-phosphate 1-dehydrogenase
LTIFGASGGLTKRKLIPALYNLALEKRLPERFAVVGYARSEMSHEEFREKMRAAVSEFSRTGLKDESVWRQFAATLYYVAGSYEGLEGYRRLKEFIEGFDHGSRALPVRVFYLATPPDLYGPVIQKIAAVRLASRESDGAPRTRVIIEKPFGTDLQTARELNHVVHEVLDEQQVDDATLVLADQSRKAIAQIVALAQELLSGKMAAEKASAIAQRLASGEWTHDFR